MNRKLIFLLSCLLGGFFLASVALGGTIVGTGSSGSQVTLEDVQIEGLSRTAGGVLMIGFYNYSSGSGDIQTIPMDKITYVEFFKEGASDYIPTYNLTLQQGQQQKVFEGVTIYEYSISQTQGAGIIASEAGKEDQRFFISASSIVTALRGEDRLTGNAAKAAANLNKLMSGQELSEDEINEIADAWLDESEIDIAIDRKAEQYDTIFNVIQYLFTGLSCITAIWLAIYAFSTEDSKSGIFIILGQVCCCFFWIYKIIYSFKYQGSSRGLLMGLITLELLCIVAVIVVIMMFGVEAFSMISSFANR